MGKCAGGWDCCDVPDEPGPCKTFVRCDCGWPASAEVHCKTCQHAEACHMASMIAAQINEALGPFGGEPQSSQAAYEAARDACRNGLARVLERESSPITVTIDDANNTPTTIKQGYLVATVSMPRALAEEMGLPIGVNNG